MLLWSFNAPRDLGSVGLFRWVSLLLQLPDARGVNVGPTCSKGALVRGVVVVGGCPDAAHRHQHPDHHLAAGRIACQPLRQEQHDEDGSAEPHHPDDAGLDAVTTAHGPGLLSGSGDGRRRTGCGVSR